MRKKHLMQVRKAMAAFLAVAMIGQNSLVTTAESYVVEDQAIVAQEENQYEQEPQDEVQQEQPAVQERPVAQEQVQAEPIVVQEEPAVPAEEGKTEPQGEEPPSGNAQENPTIPQENPKNPEGNVQKSGETEKQGEKAGSENNGQAASENPTQENGETTPVEATYPVTFDSHAADHGKIQVQGEAPQETQNPEEQEKSVQEEPLILEQDTTVEQTNDIINSNEEIQALENNAYVYTLVVEYEYEDGGRAENSYYGQYEAGTEFEVTVPVKNGYTITCNQEGYYDSSAGKIKGRLNSDLTLILTYSPDEVSYRVNHRFEQLDGSFTEEPETVDSVVGETTAAQVKVREGYTAVTPIQQLLIDDSTVINIEYFLNTYKVIYNTEGGTYVAPAYVKHGGAITVNAAPTRIGYKFGGWYLDEDYNTAAGTEITVTNDFTLYAKWDAENVNYTVVYWYENADDNNYSYAYSELRQAVTGSEQTLKTAIPADSVHFEFKDADKVTIKADGSTVMNVHFSRKSYTLTFKDGRKTVATIKAKYNQYIAGKFNETPFNTTYNGRAWLDTGSTYTYALQTLDRMPDKNVTFNLYEKNSNVLKTIYYYVESVDGKGEELLKTVSTYFNYMTYEEEYHEIAGFERLSRSEAGFNRESKKDFNRNNTGVLHYKRKSFNLVFMNGGVRDKTESLKYEAPVSEKNYIPNRPEGTPDYYEFAGWYYDEVGTNEVAWATEKMPLNGLVVYAKWAPKSFTVTFDTQGGSSVDSKRVAGGTMASAPSAPTMDAYNFVGWYVSTDTNAAVFDFGMPITSDCVVYARWEKITVAGYTINYFKKGTTDPVFASESQMGYVGAKINALAKFDNNWIVDEVSKSITLGWDADKNVITFYYAEPHDVYYKVKYVDAVTGNEVAAEKIQSTRMAQVMENAVEVSGYEYDARRKSLVLNDEASEQEISHNIITFTYRPILEVTIEGNSNTVKYDGNEQKAEGFTVKNLPENSGIGFELKPGYNAEAKGTDADTYYMGLTTESFVPSFGTTSSYNGNNCVVRIKKVTDGKLTIEPRKVTLTSASDSKKYDGEPLTCAKYELVKGTIAEGQTAQVTVEGSQTLVGSSANVITGVMILAQIDKEFVDVTDNYEISKEDGKLEVTDGADDDPVDPGKVVTKIHEEKVYELGEKVTFTIRVQNIYDTVKTIRIEELAGVTIKGAAPETPSILEVQDIGAGEFVEVEATYVITETDIAKGHFENTVKVKFIDGKPFENKDTVATVDPVKSYKLEKKASESRHESGKFKAGETIHYIITVKNTGNQTLEMIEIQDTLQAAGIITNIQGAEYVQDGKTTTFIIRNLAPQTEETQITYDYIVLEADKGNTISNGVVGSPAEPDGKILEDGTRTEVEDPKVEVKKSIVSITAADGTQKDVAGKADKDDIITYSVTVTNTGNVKLTTAKITDSLEEIQLPEGQSFELGNLECGESKSVTYTYVVKEADLGKNILNVATVTAEVPEDPEDTPKPEGKDEKEVPTEDPANCSIVVTKQLVNIRGDLLSVASAQFYVSLFADEAMTQKVGKTKAIIFGENQGTMSVTFDQLKRGVYYVAETDAEGKVITSGTYNNGSFVPQYGNGSKVEITENGATAEFKFDNQFLLLPDEYYVVKTITITKNVQKKNGGKLKSDETFYAGIFTDAEHTQLADIVSENIVPLAMNGKAVAAKTIDVTVPIGGEEVSLYITEVTADGTPVEKDDAFEYDVEVAGDTAVLSENSENAEVVITNTSRKDEPAEPTKPAEPTEAPEATITSVPENAVPVNGVKTGDDTPIGEFSVVLFLSAAYLVIAAIRRKKTNGR